MREAGGYSPAGPFYPWDVLLPERAVAAGHPESGLDHALGLSQDAEEPKSTGMANAAFAPEPVPDRASPAVPPFGTFSANWRLVLPQTSLPLPVLRPLVIGSDPLAGLQLQHTSIESFHARITRVGDALELVALGDGRLEVDGRPTRKAMLRGGEAICVGDLNLRIERGEAVPAVIQAAERVPTLDEEFREFLLRELRRAPWFAVSIAFHLGLFLVLKQFDEPQRAGSTPLAIQATLAPADEAMVTEELVRVEPTEPEPTPTDVELPDPVEAVLEPEELAGGIDLADDPIAMVDIQRTSALGTGQSGGRQGVGFVRDGVSLSRVGGPLGAKLRDLRGTGVDLVFLIDTTMSMDPFIDAAKRTVDQMITELSRLVPNLRIGMVAYRDRGDEYVTKAIPISTDRYQILNFLQGLRAFGGGDTPEDVMAAVDFAFEELQWRPRARRVVLIVADAPPHAEDMARLRMKLRAVTGQSSAPTVVSTIFAGTSGLTAAQQDEAEKALREIAHVAGGEYAPMAKPDQIKAQIVELTLGGKYATEAERILREQDNSSRKHVVARLRAANDVEALVRKLYLLPVEPLVVSALVEIDSPGVAIRCLDIVQNKAVAPATREAALYVLKRTTKFEGEIDFGQPIAAQEEMLTLLRDSIDDRYRPKPKRRRGG